MQSILIHWRNQITQANNDELPGNEDFISFGLNSNKNIEGTFHVQNFH
jgi:hypothetical protein